jgi:hypothetical protein
MDAAISNAAKKWGSHFYIGNTQLEAVLQNIYKIETKDYVENGQYNCTMNPIASGPFQIKDETYRIVTNACADEYMQPGLDQCDNDILNRCDPEDAAELAVRILLFSGGAWQYGDDRFCGGTNDQRSGRITDAETLYKAICGFGTGDEPIARFDGRNYCQEVFYQMGWDYSTYSSTNTQTTPNQVR